MSMDASISMRAQIPQTPMTGTTDAPAPQVETDAAAEAAQVQKQQEAVMKAFSEINSSLGALSEDFGSSAISLPQVMPSAMGNLSTADLLAQIRKEAKVTADALIAATAEMVKLQQADIRMKSSDRIAKLNDSITKLEEAERKRKEMEVVKWALFGLTALICVCLAVAAVVTGGATLALMAGVMAAMMAVTACLTEIKDEEGLSTMDRGIRDLGAECAKLFQPDEDADEKGSYTAMGIFAAIQILIAIAIAVATMGAGAPAAGTMVAASTGSAAANAATTAATAAATTVTTAATQTASQAVKAALETVKQALMSVMRAIGKVIADNIDDIASVGNKVSGILQVKTGIDQIETAIIVKEAEVGQADAERLKALIKMLEKILEGEQEFIAMLAEIQAKLDGGLANVVATEHQAGMQIAEAEQQFGT